MLLTPVTTTPAETGAEAGAIIEPFITEEELQSRVGELAYEIAQDYRNLGVTPELILANSVLYARIGGQFTRLKDGVAIREDGGGSPLSYVIDDIKRIGKEPIREGIINEV